MVVTYIREQLPFRYRLNPQRGFSLALRPRSPHPTVFEKLSETPKAWFLSLSKDFGVEMQARGCRWSRYDAGSRKPSGGAPCPLGLRAARKGNCSRHTQRF